MVHVSMAFLVIKPKHPFCKWILVNLYLGPYQFLSLTILDAAKFGCWMTVFCYQSGNYVRHNIMDDFSQCTVKGQTNTLRKFAIDKWIILNFHLIFTSYFFVISSECF